MRQGKFGRYENMLSSLELKIRRLLMALSTGPDNHTVTAWKKGKQSSDTAQLEILYAACSEWLKQCGTSKAQNTPADIKRRIEEFLTLQTTARENSEKWLAQNDHIQIKQEVYYPALAYLESEEVIGFEYLFFKYNRGDATTFGHRENEFKQCPTPCEDGKAYFTFYSHSSMAMLMSGFSTFPSSVQNTHVICKGFREFNKHDRTPHRKVNNHLYQPHPWYVDSINPQNVPEFVKSVTECKSFCHAAKQTHNGQPLRRIVVWILETGHFESFCWDQMYDENGKVIGNLLYIVCTLKAEDHEENGPEMHQKLLSEFKKALIHSKKITEENTKTIENMNFVEKLAESLHSEHDMSCVFVSAFSVFLLSNIIDIESWDGSGIPEHFWQFCRIGYLEFELGLISTIETALKSGCTVLICPELKEKHLNIKDVHLLTQDTQGIKQHIRYDWVEGWVVTQQ